jgi:hypothetical protein
VKTVQRKPFELAPENEALLERQGARVRKLGGLLKDLFFGSSSEARAVVECAAEDLAEQVDVHKRRIREGDAIETEGHAVDDDEEIKRELTAAGFDLRQMDPKRADRLVALVRSRRK